MLSLEYQASLEQLLKGGPADPGSATERANGRGQKAYGPVDCQAHAAAASKGRAAQGGERTMHRRVGVERPGDALQLAHHALGGLGIRQHKVEGAHALSIQPCACTPALRSACPATLGCCVQPAWQSKYACTPKLASTSMCHPPVCVSSVRCLIASQCGTSATVQPAERSDVWMGRLAVGSPRFLEYDWATMISMPRLTKYLGAQASSSRLPEAKPWYACTRQAIPWQLPCCAHCIPSISAWWVAGLLTPSCAAAASAEV